MQCNDDPGERNRKGTGYSDAAYHLKRHAMSWAITAPKDAGLTRSEREVLAAIIWRFDIGKGYALLTYEDLADAATNLDHRKGEPRAEPLGRRALKNVAEPVQLYALTTNEAASRSATKRRRRTRRRIAWAGALVAAILGLA